MNNKNALTRRYQRIGYSKDTGHSSLRIQGKATSVWQKIGNDKWNLQSFCRRNQNCYFQNIVSNSRSKIWEWSSKTAVSEQYLPENSLQLLEIQNRRVYIKCWRIGHRWGQPGYYSELCSTLLFWGYGWSLTGLHLLLDFFIVCKVSRDTWSYRILA